MRDTACTFGSFQNVVFPVLLCDVYVVPAYGVHASNGVCARRCNSPHIMSRTTGLAQHCKGCMHQQKGTGLNTPWV